MASEVPEAVKKFLAMHSTVTAIIKPHASPQPMYEFQCTKCEQELWVRIECVESSAFRFWGKEFSEGKPSIDDASTTIRCQCDGVDYDLGEEELHPYM